MTPFQAIKKGNKKVLQHWRLCLLLYISNILMALVVIIPLNSYLQSNFGNTLAINDLISGFDMGLMTDIMSNYGIGVSNFFNLSILIIGIFLVFSIFTNGGIICAVQPQNPFSYAYFLKWCMHYFWRMLRLTIYFLLVHLGLVLIFWSIFMGVSKGFSPDHIASEAKALHTGELILVIYGIIASFIFLIQDYIKISIVHQDKKFFFSSIRECLNLIRSHFLKMYGLYLLIALFFLVVWLIYTYTHLSFENTSFLRISLYFFISQVFVFFRIYMRTLNLASANEMYRSIVIT